MTPIRLQLHSVTVGRKTRRIPHNKNARLHWGARADWNNAWYDEVGWAWKQATNANPPRLPVKFPRITIVFYQIQEMDYDGMAGAGAALLDGLRVAHVIADDSPAHIQQPVYVQKRVEHQKDEHVEIEVCPSDSGVQAVDSDF